MHRDEKAPGDEAKAFVVPLLLPTSPSHQFRHFFLLSKQLANTEEIFLAEIGKYIVNISESAAKNHNHVVFLVKHPIFETLITSLGCEMFC